MPYTVQALGVFARFFAVLVSLWRSRDKNKKKKIELALDIEEHDLGYETDNRYLVITIINAGPVLQRLDRGCAELQRYFFGFRKQASGKLSYSIIGCFLDLDLKPENKEVLEIVQGAAGQLRIKEYYLLKDLKDDLKDFKIETSWYSSLYLSVRTMNETKAHIKVTKKVQNFLVSQAKKIR